VLVNLFKVTEHNGIKQQKTTTKCVFCKKNARSIENNECVSSIKTTNRNSYQNDQNSKNATTTAAVEIKNINVGDDIKNRYC